jgi:uncharacterized protein
MVTWSAFAEGINELKQKAINHDPLAQYELAIHYQTGDQVEKSLAQAKYWFEQAAENGNVMAQSALVKTLLDHAPSHQDIFDALYWLTLQAVNGNQSTPFKLGQLFEHYGKEITPTSQAIVWYRLSSHHSKLGKEKYSELLEKQFNDTRLKQIDQLKQLNNTFDDNNSSASHLETATTNQWAGISTDIMTISGLIALVLLIVTAALIWKKRRNLVRNSQIEEQQTLKKQLNLSEYQVKKLRQKLVTITTQYKKLQQTSTSSTFASPSSDENKNQKTLATACTLFGCTPSLIPEEKVIKQRYRQLSKIYHPDTGGNSAAMTQLNQSFKLLISIKKTHSNR